MTNELRVPTIRVQADVDYAGGMLSGSIFLPSLSPLHAGAPHPEEWINHSDSFFPFVPEGESRAVILNKERVRAMSLPLTPEFDLSEEDKPFAVGVTVACGERELSGKMLIEMPEGHTRLLDYMNTRLVFLPLWDEGVLHLIRKSCITKVFETEGV